MPAGERVGDEGGCAAGVGEGAGEREEKMLLVEALLQSTLGRTTGAEAVAVGCGGIANSGAC